MNFEFMAAMHQKNSQFFEDITYIEAGTEILNENDACTHVIFLISGMIEVYKMSENGKQFRLYTIQAGESCVLNFSAILSGTSYMANAKAMTDLKCVLMPKDLFLTIFNEEESIKNYVFHLVATRLIQITSKVEGMVLDTLENRLRNLLLEKKQSFIYTTHEELASTLGSAREVVSRQLKKWEKEGLISLSRGKIQLLKL